MLCTSALTVLSEQTPFNHGLETPSSVQTVPSVLHVRASQLLVSSSGSGGYPAVPSCSNFFTLSQAAQRGEESGFSTQTAHGSPSYPAEQSQWPEAATQGSPQKLTQTETGLGKPMVFLVGKRQTVPSAAAPAWCQVTVRLNKQPQRLFLHPDQPRVIDNLGE